jgi:hypothetical protein
VAAFGGVEKIQNGGHCHGIQGIKWLPNTKRHFEFFQPPQKLPHTTVDSPTRWIIIWLPNHGYQFPTSKSKQIGIGWTNFAAVAMETKKGGFEKKLDSFHQICRNIHRSVWQLLEG